jgi:uncharacterized protein (TIGR00299 family) protein
LKLLGVPGFTLEFRRENRAGLSAMKADVRTEETHHHRHFSHIRGIFEKSGLSQTVRTRAISIFERLARAEAKVHNTDIEQVHFHEVGALDAIVDIAGACIGFDLLGVDCFVASPLNVGSGTVTMAHGTFPVPPPAVAELLRDAPVYSASVTGELVTPTGAAIITTLATEYGRMPAMNLLNTGYGAGTRSYEQFPNVIRLMLGETEEGLGESAERLVVLETNVDDMNPQLYGVLLDKLLDVGALDCFFTAVSMKKNRPGTLITVLCEPATVGRLKEIIFSESTTLGIRIHEVDRVSLRREVRKVTTDFGDISIKFAEIGNRQLKAMPEFEDCRRAAERFGVPVRVVAEAAQRAVEETNSK